MELQLVNLTKEFGNFRAVNNLNLTIDSHEIPEPSGIDQRNQLQVFRMQVWSS